MKLQAASFLFSFACIASAQVNVLTYHYDNLRSGTNAHETTLKHSNVNQTTFGKVGFLPADGKVDAQPLYVSALSIGGGVHNVVYVATEHDSVYAYDADSGTLFWKVTTLGKGETPSDNRSCANVTPEIGITATPAIDLSVGANGIIYVVAMTKDSAGSYHQRLHALNLVTGQEQLSGPREVKATYPGTGVEGQGGLQTFDPGVHKHRASLLIANGKVITTWSSHCDIPPYTGWMIAYDKTTLTETGVLNVTPNGSNGGFWSSGTGPGSDGTGYVFSALGNGTFDTELNASGFPVNSDFGNGILKIGNGTQLGVADYFTMFNTVSESDGDDDLGSGGLVLLPPLNDATGAARNLAVVGGKDQSIYIVDRNNLGKFNTDYNNVYQQISLALAAPNFGAPVYFNGHLFFGAIDDVIRSYEFSNGKFGTTPVATSSQAFTYPGAFLSVSSNGAQNPILWAYESTSPAVLHAYNAGRLTELYNSNQAGTRDQFGNGNKYIVPVVANGKVYVASETGVGVFGLVKGNAPITYSFPRERPE